MLIDFTRKKRLVKKAPASMEGQAKAKERGGQKESGYGDVDRERIVLLQNKEFLENDCRPRKEREFFNAFSMEGGKIGVIVEKGKGGRGEPVSIYKQLIN